jgi:CheY-like chemotaxis protein
MDPKEANSRTILVVEDEFSVREALKEALESEGYRVITAQNGQDGLEKIRLLPKPDLVLLDIVMPAMGGQEFIRRVLTDARLAAIPILVVSSSVDRSAVPDAAGFIKKPVDLNVLLPMVEKLATNV